MVKDLADLKSIEKRRSEKNIPFNEIKKRRKKAAENANKSDKESAPKKK